MTKRREIGSLDSPTLHDMRHRAEPETAHQIHVGEAALQGNDQQLRSLYDAFNARDIDAVLGAMTDDVDWPNAWEGGRLHGKEAVRAYWLRQWNEIDPHEPLSITTRPDGRVAVDVHQVVRARAGDLLGEHRVFHVYAIRNGLVNHMDVEEP